MGMQYSHLSGGQRTVIEVLHQYGANHAAIARHIGRHRGTVMRECRRGWCASFSRYLSEFGRRHYAHVRRSAGRQRRKLGEDLSCPAWRRVLVGLQADWSPEHIAGRLRTVPPCMRKTLTYDRGTEMALHEQLCEALSMDIYFCDAYCPWQRGTNENTNGLIRQYLPKGMDLCRITQEQLSLIERKLNTRPRRILGFRTPLEVFNELRAKALAEFAARF